MYINQFKGAVFVSFLSVVITDTYLTVMADRRATQLLPDGTFGEIVAEDAHKIIEYSRHSFYSFVGAVETAQSFMQLTNFEETIFTRRGLINEARLQLWFDQYRETLFGVPSSFELIFGGLTTRDKYKVFTLDSQDGSLSHIEREVGKLNYLVFPSIFLHYPEIAATWFEEIANKHPKVTSNDMLLIQDKLNDRIANDDRSVNKEKTVFVINF